MTSFLIQTDQCYSIVVDLPPGERLDDLASLLQLDTKNMNVRQLGINVIKEQQHINLKFSSSSTAVMPEDKAQIMLAAVSILSFLPIVFERHLNRKLIMFTFKRAKIAFLQSSLCSYSNSPDCWKPKHANFAVMLSDFKPLRCVGPPLPTSWTSWKVSLASKKMKQRLTSKMQLRWQLLSRPTRNRGLKMPKVKIYLLLRGLSSWKRWE